MLKQGRFTGALGTYFASPVAADGHIYFTSQSGVVAVLAPGGDLAPIVVNESISARPGTPPVW